MGGERLKNFKTTMKVKVSNGRILPPTAEGKVEQLDVLGHSRWGDGRMVLLKVPSEWMGWSINKFHLLHYKIDEKNFGAKFQEVWESWEVEG